MSFLVTARKWRPQTFSEVVGQEHITRTLKNSFNNNRIAHAYLFTGPRGVGKTTTARIMAKILNCQNPANGEPCSKCEMCESFNSSQSLDIIEIDGASNRRIEEIRTLRESVKYAPTVGKYKIYIIDEVHMLTTESFNALLKTLEEPPEHTIFIFATTDIHKVPQTIISRCQRFDFRRIDIALIKKQLKKIADSENINIDDKSLTLIAKKADGGLRDAQSMFDQVIAYCGNNVDEKIILQIFNVINEEVYFTISDAMIEKKYVAAFDVTNLIYENGWDFLDFSSGLIEHFRNIMTVLINKNTTLIESAEVYLDKYNSYIKYFAESDILRILSFLNKYSYELRSTNDQKLKTEISLCHLIGLQRNSTISELINNISDPDLSNQSPVSNNSSNLNKSSITQTNNLDTNLTKSQNSNTKVEVKKFEAPSIDKLESLSDVQTKWQTLVDQISSEKFVIGSILANTKFQNLENNQINILIEQEEDRNIFQSNKNYFHQKAQTIFGEKIKINLNDFKSNTTLAKIDSENTQTQMNTSSVINSIINDLGGKEI